MYNSSHPLVLLACVTALSIADTAANWPQFRGPNGSGVALKGNPPVHFSPESNVVWKTALPSGASSPCIWGDRIFLTGVSDAQLETICIHRQDGRILWRKTAPAEKLESFHKQDGSPAASTPVTDGKRVYVYFGSYGVIAYDFNGEEYWTRPLPIAETFGGFGTGSSPVLAGGRVVLNRDGLWNARVIALDAQTGAVAWETERGQSYSWCTPVVWKQTDSNRPGDSSDRREELLLEEIILPGSLQVTAYDPRDGSSRWMLHGIAGATCSSPIVADGLLFVSSWSPQDGSRPRPTFEALLEQADKDGDGALTRDEIAATELRQFFSVFDLNKDKRLTADEYNPMRALAIKAQNVLMAIRPGGKGDISESHVVWKQQKGLPYVPSPLHYEGRIYLVKDGGMASCFDAKTGTTRYLQERLGAQGSYYASPVAAAGRIYAPSLNGLVVVFKSGDSLEVLARNDMKERIFASPAIIDDTMYLRTATHLYALGARVR